MTQPIPPEVNVAWLRQNLAEAQLQALYARRDGASADERIAADAYVNVLNAHLDKALSGAGQDLETDR